MKILKWIVALPFIALALFIVARFVMCRPDGEVVRVATPMVEKIADYIVKHGVPESLEDIPDLPYGFDGCKYRIFDKERTSIEEECYFFENDKKFNISYHVGVSVTEYIEIDIFYQYTHISQDFFKQGKKIYTENSFKWIRHHGTLCSSFKQ